MKKVGIIDYGLGNIYSVKGALEYLGADVTVIDDRNKIKNFPYIFPFPKDVHEFHIALILFL